MSFWDDLGDFFIGSDEGSKKANARGEQIIQMQDQLFNDIRNYDNRANDFNQLAGTALNSLASRGVINSSVGSNAMASALAEADKNYWNNQLALTNMQFHNPYSSSQDTVGVLPQMVGSFTNAFASGAGKALGGGLFGGV